MFMLKSTFKRTERKDTLKHVAIVSLRFAIIKNISNVKVVQMKYLKS